MSTEKSELKMLIIKEVGDKLEDLFDNRVKAMHYDSGYYQALLESRKAVQGLQEHFDMDVEEGTYGEEEAEKLKRYADRCSKVLLNLCQGAEKKQIASQAYVKALEVAMSIPAKMYADEERKAQRQKAYENALSQNEIASRPVGAHPGPTIKELRRDSEDFVEESSHTEES